MPILADMDVSQAVAQVEGMYVVSVSLAVLAALALVCTMLFLALFTRLPGRWLAFAGALFGGAVFLVEAGLYSGNFEYAFGPIGVMYGAISYSGATILFCVGLVRMLAHRRKSLETQNAT